VVDHLEPVRQERPRHAVAAVAEQAANQERTVIAFQPAVQVVVIEREQVRLSHPPQVSNRDTELVSDALVEDGGRPVGPGGHRHTVRRDLRDGPVQDEAAGAGTDRGGGSDNVDLPRLLIPQQADDVLECRVPR
jgi:hypothetical protein